MSSDDDQVTNWSEVEDLLKKRERTSGRQSRIIDAEEMKLALKARVKGQDHVIDDIAELIKKESAKTKRKRPIASLLFVGPTGTGKSELVKAMAEYLYGNERNMREFLGPDLFNPESKARLIGVPVGFVGSKEGGQLTTPIINNPRQLVCFDEIEKAHRDVCNILLQLLGDGRLTEQGSGQVADFTQTIVTLTSNAEARAILEIDEQVEDDEERVNAIKSHLAQKGSVFTPELMGRIDRVCVFRPLAGPIVARIAAQKIVNLAREYSLDIEYIAPQLIVEVMEKGGKVEDFGIRALERTVNDMLGSAMVAAKEAGATRIRLDVDDENNLRINPADA